MKLLSGVRKAIAGAVTLIVVGIIGFFSYHVFQTSQTINELLTENKQLQGAISNLTAESQIGYAKVVRQEDRDGRLFTTLKFVQTAPGDPSERIMEKEYTIEGDVVYFDALIVKFDSGLVEDGRERALYLWRRVYGEEMRPSEGFPIETPGDEPARYREIFSKLPLRERELFWDEIWELANDRKRLQHLGVRAIYGNAVYTQLRPGLIYSFKLEASGAMIPEVTPDL